jgi:hypothetical protein
MTKQVSLTWEEFTEQFKPVPNHFHPNDPYLHFETYGEEVEFVKTIPNERIWTYTDIGNGSVVTNGWHFINRLGYFITEVPAEDDTDYEVDLHIDSCEHCGEPIEFACVEDDGEWTCPTCCGHEECQ